MKTHHLYVLWLWHAFDGGYWVDIYRADTAQECIAYLKETYPSVYRNQAYFISRNKPTHRLYEGKVYSCTNY